MALTSGNPSTGLRCVRTAPWAAALLALLASGCSLEGTPPLRHVIVVSIDSLRADHLGAYGYDAPSSPRIDALAEEGLVFERAYSTTSWTLPAHAALFSGLDDYTHGTLDVDRRLPKTVRTLAEALRDSGVRSVGFFSGPLLHPSFGLAQGFDEYIDCTSYQWSGVTSERLIPHIASHRDVTNPILLEKIRQWISRADPGTRHLLFLHMWDVHFDYLAPAEYVDLFDAGYSGPVTGRDFRKDPALHGQMPMRDYAHLLALYDAEIRYTDETIGEILKMLEAADWLRDAAVIVLADHGEEFFEHGHKGHRLNLFEEVVRIPLILTLPGRPPARSRVDTVVSLLDVYPTVCDLFDVPCGYRGPGTSLLPYYEGERPSAAQNEILLELTTRVFPRDLVGLVGARGKVIRNNARGRTRFFDLQSAQTTGVLIDEERLENHAPHVRELVQRLDERIARARSARSEAGSAEAPEGVDLDSKTEGHLKVLGYIE